MWGSLCLFSLNHFTYGLVDLKTMLELLFALLLVEGPIRWEHVFVVGRRF